MSGKPLDPALVRKAREDEICGIRQYHVYKKVPIEHCWNDTGKQPIGTRWVDVNKGDELNPNYRSRLVARQLKAHDRSDDCYFAPAPPLEALKTVIR